MQLKSSTMGPFTLSQLVPGRSSASSKEEKDALKKTQPCPSGSYVGGKADGQRPNPTGRMGGSTATRRSSRILQNPPNFLQEPLLNQSSSGTIHKDPTKLRRQDQSEGSGPFFGDLDSSSEEEDEIPKSLEQQASNLLAAAVMRPSSSRTAPQLAKRASITTDPDSSGDEVDEKSNNCGKNLEQTTCDLISQAIKPSRTSLRPSFLSMRRTKSMGDGRPSNAKDGQYPEVTPPKAEIAHAPKLALGSATQQDSNTLSPDDCNGAEVSQDKTALRLARGLARQRSRVKIGEEARLDYGEDTAGTSVKKIAPRRYSSGGKLDDKLERGAKPRVGGASRSLNSADDQQSVSEDSNGASNTNSLNDRFQKRRMLGRRPGRGHMMQRSSSVSNILVKEKQQLTLSLHASVQSYDEVDDLGYDDHRGLDATEGRKAHDGRPTPTAEDLYGPCPKTQHHQPFRDHNLGRRQCGSYGGQHDYGRDSARTKRASLGLGNGDASAEAEANLQCQQQRRPSGHGGVRQERNGSIGYGAVVRAGAGRDNSLRRRRNGSIGPRKADPPINNSLRQTRSGSIGYAMAASVEERQDRGLRQWYLRSDSKNDRRPSLGGSNRAKSQGRSPSTSTRGKLGNGAGLDGSRAGHKLRPQHSKDPNLAHVATGELKSSLSPERHMADTCSTRRSGPGDPEKAAERKRDTGRLEAKFVKQSRKKKRASVSSCASHGSISQGSASSGEASRRSGQTRILQKNTRRDSSSDRSVLPGKDGGKLERKLSSQHGKRNCTFNDSILSGNSDQSGDSLGSSKSERSAKLGRMLSREVPDKRRSFHDSLKSGTSHGSSESSSSTRSGPAATGKGVRRNIRKKKPVDYDGMISSYTQGKLGDTDSEGSEREMEDISAKSRSSSISDELCNSARSTRSCQVLGVHRSGARNSLKSEDFMKRRSYSLTEQRTVLGNKVVRTFSIKSPVGGWLKHDARNTNKRDGQSIKDDIIGYSDNESDYEDESDNSSNDGGRSDGEDDMKDTKEEMKRAAYTREKRSDTDQNPKKSRLRGGSHPRDEDASSVDTHDTGGSRDIWDEFENGSLIDSDSHSSGSDRTGDKMMGGSNRIVNWHDDDDDDERSDYLNPAMSPRVGPVVTRLLTQTIAIEGIAFPAAVNSRSMATGKSDSQSRRLSLLGGFQGDEEEDKNEAVGGGSVIGALAKEENSRTTKRVKKKSKRDVTNTDIDKFDWEEKAKEDKKRELKKKKEVEDELTCSQHSKMDRGKKERTRKPQPGDGHAKVERNKKRSSSLRKFAALDESGHKKASPRSKSRRSPSQESDEAEGINKDDSKRSTLGLTDLAQLTPKAEKKRRATSSGSLLHERSQSKARCPSSSKSPGRLSKIDEAESKRVGQSKREAVSRQLKTVDKNRELRRSKTGDIVVPKALAVSSTSNRVKAKGVRRTKSLGVDAGGAVKSPKEAVVGDPKPRASSVMRCGLTNKKSSDDTSKRNRSKLRKKKSSGADDADERIHDLHRLVDDDSQDACALLEKDPALAEAKDKCKCYPLHCAAQKDVSVEILEKLIQVFPKACEAQCDRGFTPLHYAVEANISTPKIKMLIKACPRALKTQDKKGQVPLHVAVSEGARLSTVRLLVFIYPESVDIETMKGETARRIAKRKKAGAEVLNELKGGRQSLPKT